MPKISKWSKNLESKMEETCFSDTSKIETNQQMVNQFRSLKVLVNNKFKQLQKENSDLKTDMQCMMEMQK